MSVEPSGDLPDLSAVLSAVGNVYSGESLIRRPRLDVFMFFSFDLVGSTALKNRRFKDFHWIDLIKHFYSRCSQLLVSFGISDAQVWKYIGDEVLFYRIIHDPRDVEQTVSGVFRCLDAFALELGQIKYAEASSLISIKSVAWMVPIKSFVENLDDESADAFERLAQGFKGDDEMIRSASGAPDFLGPNIDAGFRSADFARKKQLVVSPALASYLREAQAGANHLRIVGFKSLKGVADGALYPGIWYHENWEKIRSCFTYEERYGDRLIADACEGRTTSLDCLDEIKLHFDRQYFFDKQVIDDIIRQPSQDLAARSPVR